MLGCEDDVDVGGLFVCEKGLKCGVCEFVGECVGFVEK